MCLFVQASDREYKYESKYRNCTKDIAPFFDGNWISVKLTETLKIVYVVLNESYNRFSIINRLVARNVQIWKDRKKIRSIS